MKRFKSWSLLLLSVIMVFTLAACGGGGGNGSSTAESPGEAAAMKGRTIRKKEPNPQRKSSSPSGRSERPTMKI